MMFIICCFKCCFKNIFRKDNNNKNVHISTCLPENIVLVTFVITLCIHLWFYVVMLQQNFCTSCISCFTECFDNAVLAGRAWHKNTAFL